MDWLQKRVIWGWAVVAFLIFCSVGLLYFLQFNGGLSSSQDKWGTFGDFFGGVLNPTLSFLAFMALLYTIQVQARASRDADEKHDEQLREGRLFQLLNVNFAICSQLTYKQDLLGRQLSYDGMRAVNFLWHQFLKGLEHGVSIQRQIGGDIDVFNTLREKYNAFEESHFPSFVVYFDSIFLVIDFLCGSRAGNNFSIFGLTALKAQMPLGARGIIFYVMLMSPKYCKYIPILQAAGFWDDVKNDPVKDMHNTFFAIAAAHHQA